MNDNNYSTSIAHLPLEANPTSTVQMFCRWFASGGRCAAGTAVVTEHLPPEANLTSTVHYW